MSEDGLFWWGYIHTDGELQIKRWFSQKDINEARISPFVESYYGPFEADNRSHAKEVLNDALNRGDFFKA